MRNLRLSALLGFGLAICLSSALVNSAAADAPAENRMGDASSAAQAQEQYKTVKIVPDPDFGTKTAWDMLFKAGYDKSVAFLPDGSFFRTASQDGKVHKFGPNGELLKSFSRKGQGPGDLQSPSKIDILDGRTLVVDDSGNRRLSLFDSEGTFLRTVKITPTPGVPLPLLTLAALGGGKVVYAALGQAPPSEATMVNLYRVFILDLESGKETGIADFRWERPRPKFFIRIMAWEPAVTLARAGADKLLVAYSGSPEIALHSFDGKKLSSFTLDLQPAKVTWKHLELAMGLDKDEQARKMIEAKKADIILPASLPLYQQLAVDSEGRLIVYDMNDARLSKDVSFRVYSLDGKLLASVRLDFGEYERAWPVHFWKDYAYAFLTKSGGDGTFVFSRFKLTE